MGRDRNCGRDKIFRAFDDERLEGRLRFLGRLQFVLLFESKLTRFALARAMLLQEILQPTHPHLDILFTYRASHMAIADDRLISDSNDTCDSLRPGKRSVFTAHLQRLTMTYTSISAVHQTCCEGHNAVG